MYIYDWWKWVKLIAHLKRWKFSPIYENKSISLKRYKIALTLKRKTRFPKSARKLPIRYDEMKWIIWNCWKLSKRCQSRKFWWNRSLSSILLHCSKSSSSKNVGMSILSNFSQRSRHPIAKKISIKKEVNSPPSWKELSRFYWCKRQFLQAVGNVPIDEKWISSNTLNCTNCPILSNSLK